MKELLLISAYVVGSLELLLGVYFIVTNSKNEIRRVMALLAISTGVWVILSAATSYQPYTLFGYYETAILFLSAALLMTSILHLSLVYPMKFFRFDTLHALLLYVPVIFIGWALFFSRTIVSTFYGSATNAGYVIGGSLYAGYNLYLILVYVLGVAILGYRAFQKAGYFQKRLRLILLSFLLGGLPGVIYYLIIPIFYSQVTANPFVGVLPTVIWVGVTSYLVMK